MWIGQEAKGRENEADDATDNNDSSDQDETASEESQSKNNDAESDSVIQKECLEPCHHCQNWNVFATAVIKCPSSFWHDNYSICPICGYEIPADAEYIKEAFARCYDCGAHENMKTSKGSLYFPSELVFSQ